MFRLLVEREKIIIGAIRSQGLIDTLHYLKSVEEKIQGNLSHSLTQRPKTWYYYAAAAVVTLLIAVTLLLPSQQTSDELFADYFTPYGNIFEPTVRGDKADSKTDTKRSQAFHAYERKDYQQAEILFYGIIAREAGTGNSISVGKYQLNVGPYCGCSEKFFNFNS